MSEPAEFSEANDPPEEKEKRSPYLRMKSKVSKKINEKFLREASKFVGSAEMSGFVLREKLKLRKTRKRKLDCQKK